MDDWVSANELWAAGIKEHGYDFNETVCARAEAGLIKAKAARVIIEADDERHPLDDVDLPSGFWWAKGRGAMEQNWQTGDFSCLYEESGSRWDDHKIYHLTRKSSYSGDMRVSAYGVQFDRQGASLLCPQLAPQPEPTGKPLSQADEQKFFRALREVGNHWTEPAAQAALAGLFPGKIIPRKRLREGLKVAGLSKPGAGRPENSPKSGTAD